MLARSQQIPQVHNLRVDEVPAERAPGLTGLWEDILTMQIQKLKARGRWDDTNQTVNFPLMGRRQAGILHFLNLSAAVFPKGRWLHHVI